MSKVNIELIRAERRWVREAFRLVMGEVEDNLTGKVLKKRSGKLLRNVKRNSKVTAKTRDEVGFRLGVSSVYGRAWERGFTRRSVTIRKHPGAMKFNVGGETVFAKRVRFRRQRFKSRSFLNRALRDKRVELDLLWRTRIEVAARRIFPKVINININMPLPRR